MFHYLAPVIFLGVLVLLVVVLCGIYMCLKLEICCKDKKDEEYTRLQVASEEVESDSEYHDKRATLMYNQNVVIEAEVNEVKKHSPEEKNTANVLLPEGAKSPDDTDGDVASLRTVSAYGERTRKKDVIVPKIGKLHLKVEFVPKSSKLKINIIEAKGIPSKDRGGAPQASVHAVLLPGKKHRYKTKARSSSEPVFKESTTFNKIKEEELTKQALRFRIYGIKAGKEKLVGETFLQLVDVASASGQVVDSWRDISAAKPES